MPMSGVTNQGSELVQFGALESSTPVHSWPSVTHIVENTGPCDG